MRWTWLALVLLWPGVAWAGDPHLGSPRSASQADIKERYQLALRDRPCAVMIGDSITALLFDADALPGWEVANLGRLGTTTFDWLNDGSACEPDVLRSARCGARQELDGVSCTPAVLHVMLGTNDAGGTDNGISWPPAWQEAFYRQLIGDLRQMRQEL